MAGFAKKEKLRLRVIRVNGIDWGIGWGEVWGGIKGRVLSLCEIFSTLSARCLFSNPFTQSFVVTLRELFSLMGMIPA